MAVVRLVHRSDVSEGTQDTLPSAAVAIGKRSMLAVTYVSFIRNAMTKTTYQFQCMKVIAGALKQSHTVTSRHASAVAHR